MTPTQFDPADEFDRQVRTLLEKGYPAMAGVAEDEFTRRLAPLRQAAVAHTPAPDPPTEGRMPFVLVIAKDWAPAHRAMALTELRGKPGFADFDAADIGRFGPVDDLPVPAGPAYLVVDVDRGADLRNLTPDQALVRISTQGRTPITVEEGIAFVTQHPASLRKNHCFSLMGSRCGDRRVPALWISERAPKLGWCWAGNPHTWLGSASCGGRVSAHPHQERVQS